jgi:hypothetical protein
MITAGQLINDLFLLLGSVAIAVTLLYAMWFAVMYTFQGGDDMERLHAKHNLLYATITLMFIMMLWGVLSITGTMLGL